MGVLETIRARVAVREFLPEAVPEASLRRVLEAGRWTPSQRNRQPWHFIVVEDRERLRQIGALAPSGGYIGGAPLAIAVAAGGAKPPVFDAARAIENMELAAWEEGLGTCYVGQIDRDAVKALLGIPAEMELITVMPFGFPTPAAKGQTKNRKALAEIAHRERYGAPWSAGKG
ncbi:MAG: nitroreductase [Dehalococcoidia bacterium]|nr:nitroreductase [Dehalococcoidia bacterium]